MAFTICLSFIIIFADRLLTADVLVSDLHKVWLAFVFVVAGHFFKGLFITSRYFIGDLHPMLLLADGRLHKIT